MARKVSGQSATIASILRGIRVFAAEAAVSLKVTKLAWEVSGLHAVAAGSEVGLTGLHLDQQLVEVMLDVAEVCLLAVVLYHFRVC